MQTEQSNFCVIVKPRNNSDEWNIDGCSLCRNNKSESFAFDSVVRSTIDHASFYKEVVQDRVRKFLSGCNTTVVAYGAANAGKSHTIIGTAGQTRLKPEARGVIARAAGQLFDYVHSPENSGKVFHVTASFFHVFDDGRVADLLDTQKRNVNINGGAGSSGATHFTADVSRHTITSVDDVVSLVERGSLMRNASGCIRNKQQPSLLKQQPPLAQLYKRHLSHAFFCLTIEQKENDNSDGTAVVSELQIVDLAGHNIDKYYSECCQDAGINILHKLMSMELTMVEDSSPSLCKLLAQSFGGNNLTTFICNVQLENNSNTTSKCLNTANIMVNRITNNAVINKVPIGMCKISHFINEANAFKETVAKKCGVNGNIILWKYGDDGQLNINGTSVGELSGSCHSIVQKINQIETQLIQGGKSSKKPSQNAPMQFPLRAPLLPVKSRSPLLATPASLRPLPVPLQVTNKPPHNQEKKTDHLTVAAISIGKGDSLSNVASAESEGVSDTESEEEGPTLPPAGILPALSGIPHVLPEPSVQPQPVPLLPTASSTAATSAHTPPMIHVQPQTSELAYDTSSLQGFASSSPTPGDVDSVKTPSLSNSEDDDSVVITPRTKSPSPPAVLSPTSPIGFEIPSVSPHSLDNVISPSVPQSRSLVPLVLPPSRQTLAPLNLPSHLPQQAPPGRITQSLNTSASSEVSQDDTAWASPRSTLTQPVLPPIDSSRANQPSPLPSYDQVHGDAPSRGRPQLPSYTASPTPEPLTSNADEDHSGITSLEEIHISAMDGVKSATMKKLALRCGVDYRDHGGRTPLMYAVLGNQPKMCELLIQLGADVNATDYASLSPLLWSAYHLRPIPMRILLRHDADSSFCDSEGRSAFHWSCKSPDTKCLKLLCKYAKEGVADKVDGEGLGALHWAVMCDNDAHIRLLLSSTDASASITDREGRTALNYAVLNYSPHCIKAILDNQELTVNHTDPKGRTVLHYCCAEGSVDCVRALISYKSCDINAQDSDGTTPLHWAAAANQAGVLQYLLRHGADRTLLDNQGMSALDHAQQREYQQCVTILESYGLKRQLSVFSIASQVSLPVQPPRPVDQHGHIIPRRPGRHFSLSSDSMATSTSSLHRPPGDGHAHPDGAGDSRTPLAMHNQQSAGRSSSAHCTAETSSMVPCQGGSTISVASNQRRGRGTSFSRVLSALSCGLGSCSRSNAIAPAELATSQSS